MTEETQGETQPKEDNKPAEPPTEKEDNSHLNMASKLAERLNAKAAELKEVEARIDKKMADFKKFLTETEVEGKTNAGQPPKTEEQKAIDAAQSLLTGTGLNPFK